MSTAYTFNYAQIGITKWAVVHAWGEGNMLGLQFASTAQPVGTSANPGQSSIPPTGTSYTGYTDGYLDGPKNPRILQQTQQLNYANGGGGSGILICGLSNYVFMAACPLQTFYGAYGFNNSFTYASTSISPIMAYCQSLINTLPANTGIIIAPTANVSGNTNTGFGIQNWCPGTSPVSLPGGNTASLFFNVNYVISQALKIPGAYFHSHVCLMGEFDVSSNTLNQDQFSFYFNAFISALNLSIGVNPGAPIVFGDLCLPWLATQTGGTNNSVTNSIKGIANRYTSGAYVESVVSPPLGTGGGVLNADSTAAGWTGTTGPYFGAPSARTFGMNLFNYGYATIPQVKNFTVPPITGLGVSATTATNLVLTWSPSTSASAYDFVISWSTISNGQLLLAGKNHSSGANTYTITGLTQQVPYSVSVYAISDWGYSTPVTIAPIFAGNAGGEVSPTFSSLTLNRTIAPSDSSTTITITVTVKNTANQPMVGFNTGALTLQGGGPDTLLTFNPNSLGDNTMGGTQATNASGVASWTVLCSSALTTSITCQYGFNNVLGSLGLATFTFGNPAIQSAALSTVVPSATTTPADGVTTMTVTATFISLGGTPIGGFGAGQLVVSGGSATQVYFTPGSVGGPGNAQTANGSGQAIWTLKSGNYIGGNPSLTLSTANITQAATINFAAQVAVVNVDLIIPLSSTTTPNTGVLPSATLGNGTAYAMTAQASGTPQLKYTPSTINGVTKNWFDTSDIYALGGSHAAMISTTPPPVNFSFSFSCWLKITQLTTNPANNFTVILGQNATGAPSANFHVLYADFNPTTPWAYQGLISNVFTNQLSTPFPNSTFPVSAWHHLVVVYDNTGAGTTNTMKGYMDGNATPIFTATAAQTGSTGGWNPNPAICNWCWGYAGSNQPSTPYQMADFVAYNIALTPTQVAACYNSNLLNP